jgi:hypothetical protein
MHHLYINAEFRIEDAWSLSSPASYEVLNTEPMVKSEVNLLDLPPYTAIIVGLHQAGLLEWALSTAYDELWTYIKSFFQAIPKSKFEATASVKVKDANGKLRVSMEGVTPTQLSSVKILLKDYIVHKANGSTTEEKTIEISF